MLRLVETRSLQHFFEMAAVLGCYTLVRGGCFVNVVRGVQVLMQAVVWLGARRTHRWEP